METPQVLRSRCCADKAILRCLWSERRAGLPSVSRARNERRAPPSAGQVAGVPTDELRVQGRLRAPASLQCRSARSRMPRQIEWAAPTTACRYEVGLMCRSLANTRANA